MRRGRVKKGVACESERGKTVAATPVQARARAGWQSCAERKDAHKGVEPRERQIAITLSQGWMKASKLRPTPKNAETDNLATATC